MNGGRGLRLPDAQWSTAAAPAEAQFDLWREAVDQAFVPVEVSRPAPGAFVSDVSVHRLGPVELSQIAAPPQTVERTAAQVAAHRPGFMFLNLPLTAGAVVEQAGRRAELSAGDFAVIDGDVPFDLSFDNHFRQVSLKLPRELLLAGLASSTSIVGTRVVGGSGVGAVASGAIKAAAAAAGTLDLRTSALLADRLVDLVVLALGGVADTAEIPRPLLLQAVLDETERRIGDPELSPQAVADAVGISLRYVHRLFSDTGRSFGRWVLLRRLELARHDLLDVDQSRRTVASIALSRGFGDPSYFSRAFRTEYGIRPQQLRRPG